MFEKIGELFSNLFLKFMPNAFVFAILLTLTTYLSKKILIKLKDIV